MTEFVDVPGGRIAYDLAGAGPLVVLSHGIGDRRQAYRFPAPMLAQAGYRVASADLRGARQLQHGLGVDHPHRRRGRPAHADRSQGRARGHRRALHLGRDVIASLVRFQQPLGGRRQVLGRHHRASPQPQRGLAGRLVLDHAGHPARAEQPRGLHRDPSHLAIDAQHQDRFTGPQRSGPRERGPGGHPGDTERAARLASSTPGSGTVFASASGTRSAKAP